MTARPSTPDLLTLHAVRLKGMAETDRIARRFDLDLTWVAGRVLDFEAYGWLSHSEFAGIGGWSLTDTGRRENEQRLADELTEAGLRDEVRQVHAAFLPLNARFQTAVSRWQTRPLHGDAMAKNDHSDHRWDDRTLDDLASIGRRLTPLSEQLEALLTRFAGYATRFDAALTHVNAGERRWVDAVGIDSCHAVWFELHEDLVATLGVERGTEHLA